MKITLSRTLILFSCLLCFACLLAPANSMALVFTPMDDLLEYQPKISQEQAMEIAYEHAVECGVPFDEYTDLGHMQLLVIDTVSQQPVWSVSFFLDCGDWPAYTIALDSSHGDILFQAMGTFLNDPDYAEKIQQKMPLKMQLRKTWEDELHLNYNDWSLELQYIFDRLYGDDTHKLPNNTDIQQNSAADLACQALVQQYGLSLDEVRSYDITYSFWESAGIRTWCIGFEQAGQRLYQVNLNAGDGTILLVCDLVHDPGLG